MNSKTCCWGSFQQSLFSAVRDSNCFQDGSVCYAGVSSFASVFDPISVRLPLRSATHAIHTPLCAEIPFLIFEYAIESDSLLETTVATFEVWNCSELGWVSGISSVTLVFLKIASNGLKVFVMVQKVGIFQPTNFRKSTRRKNNYITSSRITIRLDMISFIYPL